MRGKNFAKPPLTHPGRCPPVSFLSETTPPRSRILRVLRWDFLVDNSSI